MAHNTPTPPLTPLSLGSPINSDAAPFQPGQPSRWGAIGFPVPADARDNSPPPASPSQHIAAVQRGHWRRGSGGRGRGYRGGRGRGRGRGNGGRGGSRGGRGFFFHSAGPLPVMDATTNGVPAARAANPPAGLPPRQATPQNPALGTDIEVGMAVHLLLTPPDWLLVPGIFGGATLTITWAVGIIGVEHFEISHYFNNRMILRRESRFSARARDFGCPPTLLHWLNGEHPGPDGFSEVFFLPQALIRNQFTNGAGFPGHHQN